MIVVSTPKLCRKPPHYKAIYEAPTIKVFPGFFYIQKISSELIACYLPGIPGSDGRPPVAMRIYLALTFSGTPSFPTSSISFGEINLASLL